MRRLAQFIGRIMLSIATMALMIGVLLFVVGGSLTAYPIMRLSPKARRTRAAVNAAASIMVALQAFGMVGDGFDNEG